MIPIRSAQKKKDNTLFTQYRATQSVEFFIKEIKEDLEMLKEESFQRHEPEYFDEVEYYNTFHQALPESLILSDCYKTFIRLYIEEGKNLFEAVSAFIEVYESKQILKEGVK